MRAESCIVIGITGVSGSGKTTVSEALQLQLGARKCARISLDSFYKRHHPKKDGSNFEGEEWFQWDSFKEEIERQKQHHCLVIVEGFLIMRLKHLFDIKVYLDCKKEVAIKRRLERDACGELDDQWNSKDYYEQYVWPMHCAHVKDYNLVGDADIAVIQVENKSVRELVDEIGALVVKHNNA